jgi:thiamine biosynthesis lipoprotein
VSSDTATLVSLAFAGRRATAGRFDPTLLGTLVGAGYDRSFELLAAGDGGAVALDVGAGFDPGGIGKGLAADLLSRRLSGFGRTVVNCGGDIRVEVAPGLPPYEIEVEHPLTGERAHALTVSSGGVATSGLNVRVWRSADGGYAHHLIDPATRRPAWTGLVGVTALGATALEAETLAKAALLSGPALGRVFLAEHGGLMVREDGEVEPVGPLGVRPRLSVAVPASLLKGAAA